MSRVRLTTLSLASIFAFVLAVGARSTHAEERPVSPPAGPEAVSLASLYLGAGVLGGHQLTLEGQVPGAMALGIDPNRCSLDAFGDPRICTRMAGRRLRVLAQPLAVDASEARGRRLFRLTLASDGASLPALTLVRPRDARGLWRLLVEAEGRVTVVPLRVRSQPKTPVEKPTPAGRPCRFGTPITYLATHTDGVLDLAAQGTAPTPGYAFRFEAVPSGAGVPTYRLVCTAPTGIVPQVLARFRASGRFPLAAGVEHVIVIDGRGTHRVRVAPLR